MKYTLLATGHNGSAEEISVEAPNPNLAIHQLREHFAGRIVDAASRDGLQRFQVDRLGRVRKIAEYSVVYRA